MDCSDTSNSRRVRFDCNVTCAYALFPVDLQSLAQRAVLLPQKHLPLKRKQVSTLLLSSAGFRMSDSHSVVTQPFLSGLLQCCTWYHSTKHGLFSFWLIWRHFLQMFYHSFTSRTKLSSNTSVSCRAAPAIDALESHLCLRKLRLPLGSF